MFYMLLLALTTVPIYLIESNQISLNATKKEKHLNIDLPKQPAQNFAEQLQVLYDNPVPVASFTFGIISAEQVQRLQQLGTCVIGTANHPLEAQAWAEVGADAVCFSG